LCDRDCTGPGRPSAERVHAGSFPTVIVQMPELDAGMAVSSGSGSRIRFCGPGRNPESAYGVFPLGVADPAGAMCILPAGTRAGNDPWSDGLQSAILTTVWHHIAATLNPTRSLPR